VKAAARAVADARRHSGREYSKAAGSGVLPLVLRLLWPILFFSAYYIANFVWRSGVVAQARLAHTSSLYAAELQFMAPLAGYLLRNALYNSEPEWVASNLNATLDSISFLRSLMDDVAYGDASVGLPSALGTNKAAYSILLENGCVHNEVSAAACANYGANASCNFYYPYALCFKPPGKRVLARRVRARAAPQRVRASRASAPLTISAFAPPTPPPLPHPALRSTNPNYPVFYYGVVGTGLLPAVQQYVLLVQAAIDNRQAELGATAGGTLQPLRIIDPAVGIPGTLSAMDLDAIDQLCDAYLPAGLGALSSAVKVQGVRVVSSFAGTDVIVVSLSFVALVVLYVGYYMPTILALDAQLKRTRFLLLL
jgi:hypothetical protein